MEKQRNQVSSTGQVETNRLRQSNSGLTLVELLAVLVILGALAAIAIPRLLHMGQEARLASIQSAYAAVKMAAETAHLTCNAKPSCGPQLESSGSISAPGGTMGILKFGYPTGLSRTPSYFGIKDWINVQGGLTLAESSLDFTTTVTVDSAPDPSNCAVSYTTRSLVAPGMQPEVRLRTSGC